MKADSPMNVLLASALGAAIGSLVALQLSSHLWWLGLIVGGLVGYLSYEWKKVLIAIPQTYKATGRMIFPRKALQASYWTFLATTSTFLNVFIFLFPVYILLVAYTPIFVHPDPTVAYLIFGVIVSLSMGIFVSFASSGIYLSDETWAEELAEKNRTLFWNFVPYKTVPLVCRSVIHFLSLL